MQNCSIPKTERGVLLPVYCLLVLCLCSAFLGIAPPNTHATAGVWTIVESPNGDTTVNILSSITRDQHGHLWAVGNPVLSDGNKTVILEWDGAHWIVTPSPYIGPREQRLGSITCDPSGQLWAVGMNTSPDGYGKTLVERWNGMQWMMVPSPNVDRQIATASTLMGITPDKEGNLWAVGSYSPLAGGSRTLVEKWDGSQWRIIPSPSVVGSSSSSLNGAASDQSGHVWAVGSYLSSGYTNFQTLTEEWDGSTWNIVTSPNPGSAQELLGVTSDQSGQLWAIGWYYSDGNPDKTLTEVWDGSAWRVMASPSPGSNESVLRGVTSDQSGHLWAVGEYSDRTDFVARPLVMEWDGASWKTLFLPSYPASKARLYAVFAPTERDVWVVGTSYDTEETRYQTLVAHYGDALPLPTPGPSPTVTATTEPSPTLSPTPGSSPISTVPARPTPSPTPPPAPRPTATVFENFNSGAKGWRFKGKLALQRDHRGNGFLVYTPKSEAVASISVNRRALAGYSRITLRLKLNGGPLRASSRLFLTQGGKQFSVPLKVIQRAKTWQTITVLLRDAKGFVPSQPVGQVGLDIQGMGPPCYWDDITFVP